MLETLYVIIQCMGETEEELLKNAKEHGIKEHGYTEESWNKIISKNSKYFKKIIKQV